MCLGELGVVTRVDRAAGAATVRIAGEERPASLLLRPDTGIGQHVLVFTGYVIEVISATAAARAAALRAQEEVSR